MGFIIAICVIAFIDLACLIGLMVTGKVIGWGTFCFFQMRPYSAACSFR